MGGVHVPIFLMFWMIDDDYKINFYAIMNSILRYIICNNNSF